MLTAEDLKILPAELSRWLRVEPPVLFRSLRHLAGQVLTRELVRETAWRLAGNLPRLRRGRPALPWTRQSSTEWMPLQVVSCTLGRSRTKQEKLGAYYAFRILAGSATGLLIRQFWTKNLTSFLAQELGFTKPWEKYPFQELEELVGMRLYGLFTPELSEHNPGFQKIRAPASLQDHNRQLLRARRRDGFACPFRFTHACHRCPVGYDQCPVATHPQTYVQQTCPKCHRETWFDPASQSGQCVRCDTLFRTRLSKDPKV